MTGLAVLAPVAWVWWCGTSVELRAVVVLAGAPLTTPFLYDYDLPFMLPAIAIFIAHARKTGWRVRDKPLLLAVWPQTAWWWTLTASPWEISIAPWSTACFSWPWQDGRSWRTPGTPLYRNGRHPLTSLDNRKRRRVAAPPSPSSLRPRVIPEPKAPAISWQRPSDSQKRY